MNKNKNKKTDKIVSSAVRRYSKNKKQARKTAAETKRFLIALNSTPQPETPKTNIKINLFDTEEETIRPDRKCINCLVNDSQKERVWNYGERLPVNVHGVFCSERCGDNTFLYLYASLRHIPPKDVSTAVWKKDYRIIIAEYNTLVSAKLEIPFLQLVRPSHAVKLFIYGGTIFAIWWFELKKQLPIEESKETVRMAFSMIFLGVFIALCNGVNIAEITSKLPLVFVEKVFETMKTYIGFSKS